MQHPLRAMLLACRIAALVLSSAPMLACARVGDPDITWLIPSPAESPAAEAAPAPPRPSVAWLDGVTLTPEEATEVNTRIPVAVMIDNLPSGSRPQVGLDRADLVYELLVEGGITRFMAVYLRQQTDWIEPVRSVRTPSVIVAKELDALLAHVGAAEREGPADAGRQMLEWGVYTIDGDIDRIPFWRDQRRWAPHNMVTSTYSLRARAAEFGWTLSGQAAAWLYQEDHAEGPSNGTARQIGYNFALAIPAQPAYAAAWNYDAPTNSYLRSMAGRPHVDGRTGARLSAKNVVVQFHRAAVVDREGHVVYDQIGEGPAWVFRDGLAIEAVWSKRSNEDRTRYWATNGEELALNRGMTWVALLPAGSPFSWR